MLLRHSAEQVSQHLLMQIPHAFLMSVIFGGAEGSFGLTYRGLVMYLGM